MSEQPEVEQPIADAPAGAAASYEAAIAAIHERLEQGSDRMDRIEASMADNTDMTRDVHEVILAARSGFAAIAKFGRGLAITGGWIAKAARWLAPVVVAVVAIYHGVQTLLHGGKP
ncbi:MAG: hypothetical protein SHS37scaffold220_66 [Phage 67_12]|nr:MAG: hypothetical protein SHS37scaffold220_66 [Phage 67_12]